MKNPKVETHSRDSNSGPHDCKVDALPHDHGHHKEFEDDNFKFDENGGKLSTWKENNVGKGETARNEQFPLFPHCCQDMYCKHIKARACLGKG